MNSGVVHKGAWRLAVKGDRQPRWRIPYSIAVFPLLLAAVWWLYGSALAGWWCCDDPQILKHAFRYAPIEYFTVPEAWRALVPFSLTPWLTLAYDIDLAFFGPSPAAFYTHNLLVIAGCAFLLYLIARQWVDGVHAFAGALLFLCGTPIAVAARQLMVRHYLEGLLFFCIALLLAVRGVRSDRCGLGWLAGLAFAVAVSAKEIYLPLGFVAFLLPEGDRRQRLRVGWPFLLVMLLYIPWRWYMLGTPVGGYTPGVELAAFLGEAIRQFSGVPALLMEASWLVLTGVSMVAALQLRRGGEGWWLLLVALPFLLLGPLFPLARFPGLGAGSERFFTAIWAAWSLGVAMLFGRFVVDRPRWQRFFALVILLVLIASATSRNRQLFVALTPDLRAQYQQGRAVLAANPRDVVYLTPAVSSWYAAGLVDLRQALGGREGAPQLAADEADLAQIALPGRRVLRYDQGKGEMADVTAEVATIMAQWRKNLRPAPLEVDIAYDSNAKILRWRMGPYGEGEYLFLAGGRQSVPPQGMIRMERPPEGVFRLRYNAPAGWIAYSPSFSLRTGSGCRISWQGEGDLFDGP